MARKKEMKRASARKKPVIGIFSFTCCEGCQFTILFIDGILDLMNQADFQYFHLVKEKNRKAKFDLAIVEGAITTEREVRKLKEIRKKSKHLIAIGACACNGGIPSMKNFIEREKLEKYVYNQQMLKDSIPATGIGDHVKVDYYMYGCPILKTEFINFYNYFIKSGKIPPEPQLGPVCDECPRRGKDCLLLKKQPCLGPITKKGCGAPCPQENIPCYLCRSPLPKADFPAEIELFKSFGLKEQDIINKLQHFQNIEMPKTCKYQTKLKIKINGKKKKSKTKKK
ncbi:hypothetical protein KY335_04600 [Candidatus Woesearchaeota archaeon]|nr:hypothetical protein [Candidatus Woesearchaeota archaeon]